MNLPLLKAKSSQSLTSKPSIDRNPPPLFSNLQVSGTNRFSKAELAIWNLSQPSIQLDEYGHYVYESFTPPKASQTKFVEASSDNKINKARGCFVVNRKLKAEAKILHYRAFKKREVKAAKELDKENTKPNFSSPKANFKMFKRYQAEVSSIYKGLSSEKSERKFTFDAPAVKYVESKPNESSFEVPTNPLVEKVYQQLLAMNSETKKRIENYQASLFLSPKTKEIQIDQTESDIITGAEIPEKFQDLKDYLKPQAFPFVTELSNDDANYLSISATQTPVKQNFREEGTDDKKDEFLTPQKKALSFKYKPRKDRERFALPKLDLLKENSSKLVKDEMYQTFSEPIFGRKLKLNRHRKNKSSIISGEDLNKMTAFSDLALDEQRMSLLMTSTENTLLQKKTLFATPHLKKSDSKAHVPLEPVTQKFEEIEPEVAPVVRKPTVERFADVHKAPTRLFNINMKLFLRPIVNQFEKEPSVVSS